MTLLSLLLRAIVIQIIIVATAVASCCLTSTQWVPCRLRILIASGTLIVVVVVIVSR